MGSINNNEKLVYVFDMYKKITPYLNNYLLLLEQRYEWLQKQRSDYTELVMNLGDLRVEMNKLLEVRKDNQDDYKLALTEVTNISKKNEDFGVFSDELQELENMLRREMYNEKIIDSAKTVLDKNDRLYRILSDLSHEKMVLVAEEDIKTCIEYIDFYTRGLKEYRKINKEDIIADLKNLLEWCEDNDIDGSGLEYMSKVIDIEEEYPEKKGSEELLELLSEARNPKYYIGRGYTVLSVYRPLLSAMNHLRRVIRESREFRSVKNAINRYVSCVNDLKDYYNKSYLQAGGMPQNTKANISKYSHLRKDS